MSERPQPDTTSADVLRFYGVIKDAETAADCALSLGRAIAELPFAELGLHFGSVFRLMIR